MIQYSAGLKIGIASGIASKTEIKVDVGLLGAISEAPYKGAKSADDCEGVLEMNKYERTATIIGITCISINRFKLNRCENLRKNFLKKFLSVGRLSSPFSTPLPSRWRKLNMDLNFNLMLLYLKSSCQIKVYIAKNSARKIISAPQVSSNLLQ